MTTSIKATQIAEGGTFASGVFPSIGRSTGLKMPFYNICGGIKFSLQKDGVKRVVLKGCKSEPLAGTISVCFGEDGCPKVKGVQNAVDSIVLKARAGETLTPSENYFITCIPTVFENGLILTMETENERAVRVIEKRVNIERAIFGSMTNVDRDLTWEEYIQPIDQNTAIAFADSKLKERLVAKFDTDGDGELSYAEAAAVTDITGAVTIKTITSFDEFRHFTGVTEIPNNCFQGWSKLQSIEPPESVTRIGYSAFSNCTGLTSINIPETVTSIGSSAFSNCTGLTSINIPESLTYIPSYTFEGCTSLTTIDIPESVRRIDHYAFSNCTGLTSINIPETVTDISYVFEGCTSLTSINIPESVNNIKGAFYGCTGLTSIIIPESVTSIDHAFVSCSGLESISIPDSVTKIGIAAFYGCTGLTSINIPESVTSIEDMAFYGCKTLTTVYIPESVTSILDRVFVGCTGLISITVAATIPPTCLYSKFWSFNDAENCPIYVPGNAVEAYKTASGWSTYANRIQAIPE